MQQVLTVVQILVSIAIVLFILLQNRGVGFGRVWGSNSSFSRRGLEKVIFRLTFALTFVFIIVSILQLVV